MVVQRINTEYTKVEITNNHTCSQIKQLLIDAKNNSSQWYKQFGSDVDSQLLPKTQLLVELEQNIQQQGKIVQDLHSKIKQKEQQLIDDTIELVKANCRAVIVLGNTSSGSGSPLNPSVNTIVDKPLVQLTKTQSELNMLREQHQQVQQILHSNIDKLNRDKPKLLESIHKVFYKYFGYDKDSKQKQVIV